VVPGNGKIVRDGSGHVTVTFSNSGFQVGQTVTLDNNVQPPTLQGRFTITSLLSGNTGFTYDQAGAFQANTDSSGAITGTLTQGVEVNAIFNNELTAVTINPGARNNKITELVRAQPNGTDIVDNGTNDTIEIVNGNPTNTNTFKLGVGPTPVTAGGFDIGSATLPWRNVFLSGSSGSPGTNNFEITGASTSGTRVLTLPNANDTLVGQSTSDTLTNKTIGSAGLKFAGTSGTTTVAASSTASGTLTLPATTGTLATQSGSWAAQTTCSGLASSPATLFLFGAGGSATTCTDTTENLYMVMPSAGTLRNLFASAKTHGTSNNVSFTVRKTVGSTTTDTALTCTMTGTSCSDTSDSVSVNAGDRISIKMVTLSTETLRDVSVTFEKQ